MNYIIHMKKFVECSKKFQRHLIKSRSADIQALEVWNFNFQNFGNAHFHKFFKIRNTESGSKQPTIVLVQYWDFCFF